MNNVNVDFNYGSSVIGTTLTTHSAASEILHIDLNDITARTDGIDNFTVIAQLKIVSINFNTAGTYRFHAFMSDRGSPGNGDGYMDNSTQPAAYSYGGCVDILGGASYNTADSAGSYGAAMKNQKSSTAISQISNHVSFYASDDNRFYDLPQ